MSKFMPPGQIRLLLWYHCTNAPPDPDGTMREWTNQMLAEGLIQEDDAGHGSYTTTERGQRYVDMLCQTPLPIHQWVDPRFLREEISWRLISLII